MATNPQRRMTDEQVKATRKQVTHLMRHPTQHPNYQQHPSNGVPEGVPDMPTPVTHYALDLESPPLIACETPDESAVYTTFPESVTCPDCMTHEQFPQSVRRALEKPLPIQPEAAPAIRGYDVLMQASMLLAEDAHENVEYDRAIIELTSALIGAGPDDYALMARVLRSLKEGA